MKITNRLNLPAGFVKACSPEKHNAQGCLSATTLIMGIKQILLMERHWDELEDDVSDRLWAIWGQAVHSLMENEGENDFTEQKMAYKVKGITVTGTIDSYDMKHGVIFDYKTASVNKVKFKDFKDWYLQGMIYAWLLSKNKFPVTKCRFIALLKDFSRTEAIRDYQYPKEPVYIFEFPVTLQALFKIEMFINDKINEYRRCFNLDDNAIPPCTPEERWERPPKFAVMKQGNKKALRLFDDKNAAKQLAEEKGSGHYVEHRPGESIRCQSFCLCNRFCNFYCDKSKTIAYEVTEEKAAA